jgi:hypothetical protein
MMNNVWTHFNESVRNVNTIRYNTGFGKVEGTGKEQM